MDYNSNAVVGVAAMSYGRRVADAALDKFREAFARRGIGSGSLSALRP